MIIWLASYPRSGNTLLRIVLNSVFGQKTYSKHDDVNDIGADARTVEEVGHQFLGATWKDAYVRLKSAEETHFVKTHDQPEDDAKAIYVVRDGRSTCRSFYHYLKDFPHLGFEFSVRDVIAGFTPFGSWGDHLDQWNPQARPNTLLMKYEDLVSRPKDEIQRLAEFLGLPALREWENNFDRLHEMNPKFFRAGAANASTEALDGEDLALFWEEHGDWMQALGYGEPSADLPKFLRAGRSYLSIKGREYYNLKERVHLAEQQMPEKEEQHQQRLRETVHELRELLEMKDSQLQSVSLQHSDDLKLSQQREAEMASRLDEARQTLDRQTAEWSAKVAALSEEGHRAQQELAMQRQAAESARKENDQSLEELRTRLWQVQADLDYERSKVSELRGLLQQASDLSAKAMQQHEQELTQQRAATNKLAEVAAGLDDRVRMLMTSRLMRMGWKFGLGSEPYWADPQRDQFSSVIESARKSLAGGNGSAPAEVDSARAAMMKQLEELPAQAPQADDDMDRALQHLVAKGFNPKVVLDIGAAKGYWSLRSAWRWKKAEYFMIDPLAESEPDLQKICQNDPRFHYVLTAVGKEPGELLMNVTPDHDGSSLLDFPNPDPNRQRRVPIETLDRLIDSGKVKQPSLVKLDVQGFEINVLDGGQKMFASAEVFIIEANLFEFMPGCPRVHELVKYMADRGFHPFEFAGYLRRPYENDLGQVDIIFVRHDSPLVASKRWA